MPYWLNGFSTAVSATSFAYCRSRDIARPIVSISLRACVSVTSGFKRPMQTNEFDPGSWSPAFHAAGTHNSRTPLQNWKRKLAGITPTTVYGSPSIGIGLPTTDRSPP